MTRMRRLGPKVLKLWCFRISEEQRAEVREMAQKFGFQAGPFTRYLIRQGMHSLRQSGRFTFKMTLGEEEEIRSMIRAVELQNAKAEEADRMKDFFDDDDEEENPEGTRSEDESV